MHLAKVRLIDLMYMKHTAISQEILEDNCALLVRSAESPEKNDALGMKSIVSTCIDDGKSAQVHILFQN